MSSSEFTIYLVLQCWNATSYVEVDNVPSYFSYLPQSNSIRSFAIPHGSKNISVGFQKRNTSSDDKSDCGYKIVKKNDNGVEFLVEESSVGNTNLLTKYSLVSGEVNVVEQIEFPKLKPVPKALVEKLKVEFMSLVNEWRSQNKAQSGLSDSWRQGLNSEKLYSFMNNVLTKDFDVKFVNPEEVRFVQFGQFYLFRSSLGLPSLSIATQNEIYEFEFDFFLTGVNRNIAIPNISFNHTSKWNKS